MPVSATKTGTTWWYYAEVRLSSLPGKSVVLRNRSIVCMQRHKTQYPYTYGHFLTYKTFKNYLLKYNFGRSLIAKYSFGS